MQNGHNIFSNSDVSTRKNKKVSSGACTISWTSGSDMSVTVVYWVEGKTRWQMPGTQHNSINDNINSRPTTKMPHEHGL